MNTDRLHILECKQPLILLFMIALGAFLGGKALSQGVRVLSGEHENFSRLAIPLPESVKWSYEHTEDEIILYFNPRLEVNIDRVFDLIPRTRLQDVTLLEDQLGISIESECACETSIFLSEGGILVVDVISKLDDSPAHFGIADHLAHSSGQFALLNDVSTSNPFLRTIPLNPSKHEGRSNDIFDDTTEEGFGPINVDPNRNNVDHFTNRLIHELIAAQIIDRKADKQETTRDRDPAASPTSRVTQNITVWGPSLRLPLDGRSTHGSEPRRHCPSSDLWDFLYSKSLSEAKNELPLHLMNLVDDRGRVLKEGARKLAQTYLILTLGFEAASILAHSGLNDREVELLLDLSSIMENSALAPNYSWEEFSACEAPASTWALLTNLEMRAVEDLNVGSIQEYFFGLPEHIRLHIGPRLALALKGYGYFDASAAIASSLSSIEAISISHASRMNHSEGLEGSFFVSRKSEEPVELVIERALEELRKEERISDGTGSLLESFEDEYTGTNFHSRIVELLAIKKINENNIDPLSLDNILAHAGATDGWGQAIFGAASQAIQSLDLGVILQNFSDGDFSLNSFILDDEVRIAIAERLYDAGFTNEAGFIANGRASFSSLDWPHLRARMAVTHGDTTEALDALDGLNDAQANLIRGDVFLELQEWLNSARSYAAAGSAAKASRAALLSRDPLLMMTYGEDTVQELGQILSSRGDRTAESDTRYQSDDVTNSAGQFIFPGARAGSEYTSVRTSREGPTRDFSNLNSQTSASQIEQVDSSTLAKSEAREQALSRAWDTLAREDRIRSVVDLLDSELGFD